MQVNRVLASLAGVKAWQLTLCDLIWQVTLCSSVIGFILRAINLLYLYLYLLHKYYQNLTKCIIW